MKSIKQFFEYLNDISFPYVVLRNWEMLPHSVEYGDHSDLDLLVYDIDHFKEIFPQAISQFPYPRVRYKIDIGDEYVFMDVRHIGDGYYPVDLQRAILDTREWNESGFYTPNQIHFWVSLAYHAVHHKNENTYQNKLGNSSVKELLEALKKSAVGWVPPMDQSVGKFNPYWKGATSIVVKNEDFVVKKQTSFKGYNLMENEKLILEQIDSIHFPKLIGMSSGEIYIENCGEPLTVENLPKDWKEQLVRIVLELKANHVIHRDIQPKNLMVKDGVIKLIDFGWARLEGDKDDSPPACLGYPYKCSEGFDDHFSMRKIIKEFQFKIDQRIGVLV